MKKVTLALWSMLMLVLPWTAMADGETQTSLTFKPADGSVVKSGDKVTITGTSDYIYYRVLTQAGADQNSPIDYGEDEGYDGWIDLADNMVKEGKIIIKAAQMNVSSATMELETTVTYYVAPDQTYMRFFPYPTDVMTIVKGAETDLRIEPVAQDGKKGDVYYRILTVDGADQTAAISVADSKIETKEEGGRINYLPIMVNESMVKDGLFMVKAAVKNEDGSFSPEVTAVYNVEIQEEALPIAVTVTPVDAVLEVGGRYVFTVNCSAAPDDLERYERTSAQIRVQLASFDDVFSDIEYAVVDKGSEPETWKSFIDDFEELKGEFDIVGYTIGQLVDKDFKLRLTLERTAPAGALAMTIGLMQPEAGLGATPYGKGMLSATIEKRAAEEPTFEPASSYVKKGQTVVLKCVTEGAEIRYTTDGSEPTLTSTLYENGAPIVINTLTTIKAIAVKGGKTSFVSESIYSLVGWPQITPASGKVVIDSLAKITLKDTPEADIYYTTDGTEPTQTTGTKYTAPFPIGATVKQLKAVAVLGTEKSPVITADYCMIPAAPQASAPKGNLAFGTEVTLSCATEGAEIYWSFGSQEPISKETGKKYDGKPIVMKLSGSLKAIAYYAGESSLPISVNYKVGLSMPAFSPKPGEVPAGARVTLTSESKDLNPDPNRGYHIVYTLDGSEPSKSNGTEYTTPIEITEAVTIKAVTWAIIGASSTPTYSEIASATYWLEGQEAPDVEVAAPVFEPAAGTVEKGTQVGLFTTTASATIYYTVDGSEPTAQSTEYTQPIIINADVTIKAIAILGENQSEVTTATYIVRRNHIDVITPTFSVPAGEVEKGTKVEIACVTEGAKVYYTVDGNMPTAQSPEYKEAVVINKTLTLKAIAFVGEFKSSVAEATYTIKGGPSETDTVATPTFNPAAGEVVKGTKVAIACETENAKIYYTVDGSEPTAESAEYKEAIVINEALTLKAIAFVGEFKSSVATAAYTVKVANEALELAGVSVYPNPSNGEFTLDLPVSAMVEVFASNGVLRQRVEAGAGLVTLNIERSGIYFLRITAEGRATVKRVVVR